jgi:hypothetical protein
MNGSLLPNLLAEFLGKEEPSSVRRLCLVSRRSYLASFPERFAKYGLSGSEKVSGATQPCKGSPVIRPLEEFSTNL